MKRFLLCVFLIIVPNLVSASTEQEPTVLQQSGLERRGIGIRSKFFIDLYKASLYAPAKASSAEILSGKGQAIITLEIISGMISSEKMEAATREGFEKSLSGKDLYKEEIEQFIAVFNEEIVEGDIFVFNADQQVIEVLKNQNLLTTIRTPQFRHALLGIWLGEEPVSQSLKEEMLGN